MSVIAPLWLLLAGAAVVPLLVHLLRRRSGARTEFPAVRYLARAEREHSRSLRLRNLLLMLLRVAAVLLLAFAAARPVAALAGRWGAARAPTALAVVLDNSLSTGVVDGGRPVFESLRDSARALLDAAGPADRVWIVAADGQLLGGTPGAARAALDSMRVLGGSGDVPAAVRRGADAVTSARDHAPAVAVLTDGQRSAWREVGLPGAVRVMVAVPVGQAPGNRAVASAEARPERWTPRGAVSARFHSPDSVGYRVVLQAARGQGRTVARGVAAPGEEIVVRAAPVDSGWMAGRVEIDPDELPADDARHFALWAGSPPAVAATPGAGPFVASALDVLRAEGRVRAGTAVRLLAADEAGEGATAMLIAAPRSPAQLGAANRALARRGIPWRLDGVHGGRLRGAAGLGAATVHRAYALVPTAVAPHDTLALLDGRPWAVAGRVGAMPYVLVASALHPDATDLPVRAAFVPWLASILSGPLAGGPGGVLHATPGASVQRPEWAGSLLPAGGGEVALASSRFTAPQDAGVHFFARDGEIVGALVVNVEERESVLDRAGQQRIAALIAGPDVVTMASAGWRSALFASDGRRSLTGAALAAVLLLLVGELAATTVRARRPA